MKEKNANFITTVMKEPNILQKTYILWSPLTGDFFSSGLIMQDYVLAVTVGPWHLTVALRFSWTTAPPCNVRSNNISSPTFISSHIKTPIPRGWGCPSLSHRHWYTLNFFCCSICKSTQERGWLKKFMEMEAPSDALLMGLWFNSVWLQDNCT